MARYKHPSRKKKMIKAKSQTSWAPFFSVFRKFGKGKKVHPSQMSMKRSWRRQRLKF